MLIWEFEDLHFTWHIFFSDGPSKCWALPAQRAGSLSCWGNTQLQLCSLFGFLLLLCFTWSLSSLHVLPLQGCPYRPAPVVWEKWPSVSCMSLQYKCCGELGSLNIFSAFSYLQLGYDIRKRADMGICHLPWIISKEKLFPCSLWQTPATVPLRTELLASTVVGTTASTFTLVLLVILELLVTPCHDLFKRFWKLAYLNSFVCFSFLKDCVIHPLMFPPCISIPPFLPQAAWLTEKPPGIDLLWCNCSSEMEICQCWPHPSALYFLFPQRSDCFKYRRTDAKLVL